MEVFVDGKVMFLDNYKKLTVSGLKGKNMETVAVDKGHMEELRSFAHTIQNSGDWPIPLSHQIQATEISLEIEKQLTSHYSPS
jgi:hypothetical protein